MTSWEPQGAQALRRVEHTVDVCVVGGGMSGICAALAAARHGATVLLMHERQVLGGNASSEVRMHICGADRHNAIPNMRETGILEELRLENIRRNPTQEYGVWDLLLYETVHFQPGLTLLLNCSCLDAKMDGVRITSVSGWQQTTETFHDVNAKIFIDCSGEGILAPLTSADFRMGREGRDEFGESIAPKQADERTMGMSCFFAARKYDTPQPFTPPAWANSYPTNEDLPYPDKKWAHSWIESGYWWIELGGEAHSIYDTETLRDELLKITLGVWDHIKNHGDHGAENWALEWLQFLPGKRESRRFLGEHILTQNDVQAEGRFPDLVAYGGWSMDDHDPAGFGAVKLGRPATIFHHAPSPYGIPYRSFYSRNIDNLMFAGRNISATHSAMSSTRVMGTCCSMGQAVGTAVALAIRDGLSPREVGVKCIMELQQTLLDDDAYLPWIPQEFPEAMLAATLTASTGDPEPLRDGINRPVGEEMHRWACTPGDWAAYTFQKPQYVREATVILDSALDQNIAMSRLMPISGHQTHLPPMLPRAFRLEGLQHGQWVTLHTVTGNARRHVRLPVNQQLDAIRFTLDETWGDDATHLYAFSVKVDGE